MGKIKIKANYSIWRHPLKWLMERKTRKLAELLVNYQWDHGAEQQVKEAIEQLIITGVCGSEFGKDMWVGRQWPLDKK